MAIEHLKCRPDFTLEAECRSNGAIGTIAIERKTPYTLFLIWSWPLLTCIRLYLVSMCLQKRQT